MSDFTFEDDSNEAAEYLKALEESDKDEKTRRGGNKDDRVEFFTLKEKESAIFRVVQVPGAKTWLRQKIHYLKAINLKEINVPQKVSYVTCVEHDRESCLGEKCEEFIVNLKLAHEFDSPENKELFKKQCTVKPSPVLNVVGIDRRDGKIKLFQINKPSMGDFLNFFTEKDEDGNLIYANPAHPTLGFDFKVTRKDKKLYTFKEMKPKALTEDEMKLVSSMKDPFAFVKLKGTKEFHDRLRVTFSDGSSEEPTVRPKSEIVLPDKAETPEEMVEDDLPF